MVDKNIKKKIFEKDKKYDVKVVEVPDGDDIKVKNWDYSLRLNEVYACEINKKLTFS